jgi:transcriptional regulator with XRE-family HTH domain
MAGQTRPAVNGNAVLMARLRKGWTQYEVARKCAELGHPYDDTQISKIERGLIAYPRAAAMRVLAEALDLDVADLLARDGRRNGDAA